jgi:hypothetical protein
MQLLIAYSIKFIDQANFKTYLVMIAEFAEKCATSLEILQRRAIRCESREIPAIYAARCARRVRAPKRKEDTIITAYKEWQRVEKKYLFSAPIAYALRRRLQAVMHEDDHNGPDGYSVRSLYFDTVFDEDFFDKLEGLEQRRKVRLRIYPPDYDRVKLELKEKSGAYQRKRSLTLCADDARALIACDFGVLLRPSHPLASELFGVLTAEVYRPRCIVEYNRQAFVASGNDTRVTFDSRIRASESCLDLFAPAPDLYPVLHPSDITLEVKYSHFLFGYIRDTLGEYGKLERSVSKYCLSRQISYIQTQ